MRIFKWDIRVCILRGVYLSMYKVNSNPQLVMSNNIYPSTTFFPSAFKNYIFLHRNYFQYSSSLISDSLLISLKLFQSFSSRNLITKILSSDEMVSTKMFHQKWVCEKSHIYGIYDSPRSFFPFIIGVSLIITEHGWEPKRGNYSFRSIKFDEKTFSIDFYSLSLLPRRFITLKSFLKHLLA